MPAPLFSIIIPAYNAAPKLRRTLDSVLKQTFDNYEVLIIDACSSDETPEVIRAHGNDSRIRSISEPDDGVYHAMNKGIRLAAGRFLYFLGAGDTLRSDVLSRVAARIPKPGRTFLYGNVWFPDTGVVYDGPFTRGKLRRINICHQAIFYERTIFDVVGGYDTKYPYLADWGFNMKCFGERSIKKMYVDEVVADYEGQGMSITRVDVAWQDDYALIIRRYLGPIHYFFHTAGPRAAAWKAKLHRRVETVRARMRLGQRIRHLLNVCR